MVTAAESLIRCVVPFIARPRMSVFGLNGEMLVLNEAEVDADAQSRSELHLSLQVATARRSPASKVQST